MERQKSNIKIILADDHPLLRDSLRNILEKQEDFEVVAEAGDGEEAVELVDRLTPDVVIMDISMPNLNGLEATRRIKAKHPAIAVMILTVHSDSEHILGILQAGAGGYPSIAIKPVTRLGFASAVSHAASAPRPKPKRNTRSESR